MEDGKSSPEQERERQLAARNQQLEVELAAQRKELTGQRRTIEALCAEIEGLKAALAAALKTSATSSKPPSSDIVKHKRPVPSGTPRKIGAQPGHPLHERTPFSPDEINGGVFEHRLSCCPDCLGPVTCYSGIKKVVQQMDLAPLPVRIEEHRGYFYWCPQCRKQHASVLPPQIEKGGLCGPYLTTLVAYLKGACHASYSTVRRFLRDVAGIRVSRGHLAQLITKVAAALKGPYEELLKLLPAQAYLNVDETGHKENGARPWTWCFRAELFVLFKIEASRGSKVLVEILGQEFDGVLGCDYFSAYRKYMRECGVEVQFCLAHLIRDVKYLLELPAAETRAYGEKLLSELRLLFHSIHQREKLSATAFRTHLEQARARILRVATTAVPAAKEAQNMARRFKLHGAAYFQFITTPGMEPTNNLAEQAIRFVVIDRVITQGTRGEKGRRWCERIWSTLATCALRGVSAFEYLHDTVDRYLAGDTPASLLPNTA
jgi:transposase